MKRSRESRSLGWYGFTILGFRFTPACVHGSEQEREKKMMFVRGSPSWQGRAHSETFTRTGSVPLVINLEF